MQHATCEEIMMKKKKRAELSYLSFCTAQRHLCEIEEFSSFEFGFNARAAAADDVFFHV
jgi:hypothetical protein